MIPTRLSAPKLVSALLLGWPVSVKQGQDVGGDFQHIPTCHFSFQIGCAVGYSTFSPPVPSNSIFGRAGPGFQALCTNPASLQGGAAPLKSIFPTAPFAPGLFGSWLNAVGFTTPKVSTPWVESVAFRGQCATQNGATTLQVTGLPGAPTLHASPSDVWGLHMIDANIALGNLVDLVHRQARLYNLVRKFHLPFGLFWRPAGR